MLLEELGHAKEHLQQITPYAVCLDFPFYMYKVFSIQIPFSYDRKEEQNIYAEFLGGSCTCDAYRITEPHPDGEKQVY